MLKLTHIQQREEIKLIELHIGKLTDLEIVELQKQQIARILYFAKRALHYDQNRRPMTVNSKESDYSPIDE